MPLLVFTAPFDVNRKTQIIRSEFLVFCGVAVFEELCQTFEIIMCIVYKYDFVVTMLIEEFMCVNIFDLCDHND